MERQVCFSFFFVRFSALNKVIFNYLINSQFKCSVFDYLLNGQYEYTAFYYLINS